MKQNSRIRSADHRHCQGGDKHAFLRKGRRPHPLRGSRQRLSAPGHAGWGSQLSDEQLADGVADIIGRGHVNLVETLAEDIAAMCLNDRRVLSARVRVEKLDILEHAQSVGVEIERINSEV